jgi:hypothetical protein
MKVTRKERSRSTGQQANGSDVIWVRYGAHALRARPIAGLSICLAVACCPTTRKPFSRATEVLRDELRAAKIVADPELSDTIVIGALDRLNLTYIPSELKVFHGQKTRVTWVSEDGPFTLSFRPVAEAGLDRVTPFDKTIIDSSYDADKKLYFAQESVPENAGRPTGKPVRYHYTVTLQLGGHVPPLVDPDCPPIVVLPLPL